MFRLIARTWRKYKLWRNRPKFAVYRCESGYQSWKDSNPPKTTTWWDVLAFVMALGIVASCGVIGFIGVGAVRSATAPITPTILPTLTETLTFDTGEATAESTGEIVGTAEATAESTAEPLGALGHTSTPAPTIQRQVTRQWNEQTRDAIQATINAIVTQTAQAAAPNTIRIQRTESAPNAPEGGAPAAPYVGEMVYEYYTPPPLGTLPPPMATEPESTEEMTDEPTIPPGETGAPIVTETPTATGESTAEIIPSETPTSTSTEPFTPTYTETATATPTATPTATLAPLVAFFRWQVPEPLAVDFINESMPTIGVSYEWDFNADGIVDSVEFEPGVIFEVPGEYLVTLTLIRGEERAVYSALVIVWA